MELAEEKMPEKGRGKRILVVEDQPMISKLVRRILESSGFQVQVFNDSRLAFEKFKDTPEAFDLVITDLSMPGMNGLILSQGIKKLAPDTPVILYTGDKYMLTSNENKPESVDIVLEKPFTKDQLLMAASRCFE